MIKWVTAYLTVIVTSLRQDRINKNGKLLT